MTTAKRVTKKMVEKLVQKHGGTIEDAGGPDDWNIIAPKGYWWKEAEVQCYALPLGECESSEERQELLQAAMEFLAEIELDPRTEIA